MNLENARELKSELLQDASARLVTSGAVRRLGVRTQHAAAPGDDALRTVALGVARKGKQHRLAIRIQVASLVGHPMIERMRKRAKGEVDVRYVGRIVKRETASTLQKVRRPLAIGCSISHFKVTAGTLGAFVKSRSTGEQLLLSNNHVLADENRGRTGDAIVQPGILDGGQVATDAVGQLTDFVKLDPTGVNSIDGAIAAIASGIEANAVRLGAFGNLAGLGPAVLATGAAVSKVGRTTGETEGKITAFELDNVVVAYDLGNVRFDNQIEIEAAGAQAFSDGGDSGSLIFDADKQAVALLFAGSDAGGSNGLGVTYGNPLRTVLDALDVDLVT